MSNEQQTFHSEIHAFPEKNIQILLSFTERHGGREVFIRKGGGIEYHANNIYFLVQGVVEVRHVHSLSVIGVIDKPFPVGAMEALCECRYLLYVAKTDCAFIAIDRESWDALIAKYRLEMHIALIAVHAFFAMVKYANEVLTENTYRRIRRLLYLYDRKRMLFISSGESVSSYIMSRVPISKSQVMKILAELKKGGYISIERGFLISINRKLPEEF